MPTSQWSKPLKHSGYANDAEVKINWISVGENVAELLSDADGIIVPGGFFGQRGTEGKIQVIRYA